MKTTMFDTFLSHGYTVIDILSKGGRVNILDLFYRYTLDSIGVIGFGNLLSPDYLDINCIEGSIPP